jgi:hypothetical protein
MVVDEEGGSLHWALQPGLHHLKGSQRVYVQSRSRQCGRWGRSEIDGSDNGWCDIVGYGGRRSGSWIDGSDSGRNGYGNDGWGGSWIDGIQWGHDPDLGLEDGEHDLLIRVVEVFGR